MYNIDKFSQPFRMHVDLENIVNIVLKSLKLSKILQQIWHQKALRYIKIVLVVYKKVKLYQLKIS